MTRSPLEAAVAALWRETLGRDDVGLDEDFIALGGDSLSALSLLAAVTSAFDVELRVRDVFDDAPTVRRMAATIAQARSDPRGHDLPSIEQLPDDGGPSRGISPAQESEWFMSALAPDAPLGNVTLALRITGPLDHDRLRVAYAQLIERQPMLRARFASRDGRPEVEVVPVDATPFTVHEPMSYDCSLATASAVASTPFDLRVAPLLHAHLFPIDGSPDGHVLLVVSHHIVADGWSRGIIRNELAALYAGDALPPLTTDYLDIADQERRRLSSERAHTHVRWWAEHLDSLPDALVLAGDRARPARFDPRSAVVTRSLAPDLRADVTALSSEAGATLFMTLLAGFEALVARHTGRDDFLIGVPTNGRHRSDAHGLVGLFADVLPLRARVDSEMTFGDLLARVRAECLDVFDHQHVPVQAIINEIHPQRTANHVGLVQVLFQLRNLPAVVDTFGDARVETLDVNAGALIAELEVDVVDDGRCLTIRCEHSRAVFDSETVERLLERFECLLRDAVRCPDAPIGRLALLPSGERALLDRFGTGAPQAAPTATVPELVAERTASCAEAIAVRAAGAGITYGELERHIRALDRWLRGRGVRRGDSVGVALRREPVLVATIQALWRIGAMVVPIDPAWPSARIAVVVDDADVVMVLANREITSTFADLRVLAIEDATCSSTEGTGDPPTEAEPTVDATLDDSAYIEFTSGSTGRPKAVEVSHRSLASYCEAHRALTGLGGHDIVLASTPLTFDPAIDQLVLPLAAGAQIMIADDREYTDPAAVAALLDTGLPTVLGPTPSFLAAVVAAGWRARDTLTIWSGGEVLPPPLAATVLPRSGRLLNVYGPTETTVWATGYELTDADIDSGRSIPIGAPLAGARCIVVDARGEPSPIGVPGELLIAGERVAIGYRNQPEQTAVAFVDRDDPFDGVHRRWYRTGDQIRWRPDGALEYVGRTDSQLKVRGVRLEAAEVEAAIVTHPGVEAAAVAVRGEQLIGFYVASSRQSGAAPTPAELRGHVSDLLPSGMVPSRFVELDALPLTNSRKVDRRSLPALAESEAGRGREPSTPTEVALASMWREVLHVDHVGADDEFFEIGGHSLLVIQLFGMIEAQLGRRLPLSQIFATPTLVDLAHAVDDAADEPDTKMRLVPMRDGAGSSAALFLVPGAGGTALVFQHAVSQLRADGRVFAVEFGRVGAMSIEDRAALALPAIVDAAAGQPFIVGGYSFGGKVAFEIARQAAQSGVSCRLVIVDTPAPQAGPARQARGAARSAANAARRGLRPLRPRARDSADAVEAAELTAAQHWQRMQKAQGNANMAALRRYRPPRGAPLTAVVIASDASIKTHGDRTLWWRRYVSGTIEVRSISLDHPRLGDLRVQSEIGAILDDLIESHIQK